jgi:hypothetical protein
VSVCVRKINVLCKIYCVPVLWLKENLQPTKKTLSNEPVNTTAISSTDTTMIYSEEIIIRSNENDETAFHKVWQSFLLKSLKTH